MWAFCYFCLRPPSFDKLVTSGCLCQFTPLALFPSSFVGERGAEAAPEPDHGGELRPAREGGHHLGRGQAAAGRTRRRPRLSLSSDPPGLSPLLCPRSSSAAAAAAPATGWRAATSRGVKRRAGWSPTAAVKPAPRCAAAGTTPPTSTRWR